MSRGRRYDKEPKLNYKKVFAVIIAVIVFIMFIFMMKSFLTKDKETGKISSTTYFTIYKDNKWGVIDNLGKEVISPSYKEMIVIPNNKKDVFLCTYDINDDTGEYKTKALNSKNEEIFTQYSQIEALDNYDGNNNIWYEKNVLKVQKDGKYGLIDFNGKEVLNIEYDNISTLKGVENSILVEKDNKIGLINSDGKNIVDVNYKKIKNIDKDYKKGYIVVDENNKYGVIDYNQKQILENKYDEIEAIYSEKLFVIKEGKNEKLINDEGNVVLEDGFDKIEQILQYSSKKGVIFVKDNKYGVMDVDAEIIVPAEYEKIKEAKDNIFIAKKDGKYGIVDTDKNEKVEFKYTNITYNNVADIYLAEDENYNTNILDNQFNTKLTGILSDIDTDKGYMKLKIGDEYKYYNFKFEEKTNKDVLSNTLFLSKKDGKYGFVNSKNEVIVDYIYDDATEQNEYGYAAVKKDGKWGSIDVNGKVVIEPTYNLDNNMIINFIGKWHLGQDANMNYYCEI